MNDVKPPSGSSVFVPAKSVDPEQLMKFAAAVWPERPPERVLATWWRRAAPDCAIAAVNKTTGRMVGVCAGIPCEWVIGGRIFPATAICDWYVVPDQEGKLLGRRMIRHYDVPDRVVYGFSMSQPAVVYMGRLGWAGPSAASLLAMPLPRLMRLLPPARRAGLELEDHTIAGGGTLGPLAPAFDQIEAQRVRDPLARMRRGADHWAWRLTVCGERQYHVCLARRAGAPVGYVVVRRMTPGASRILGRRAGAIITDLVAVDDDPAVLRALVRRAVAISARLQVVVVLIATSVAAHRRALVASGFLSPGLPVVGRFLRRAAPVFMWSPRGPCAGLTAEDFAFTFADSDVDLAL
jgi:Acetyltransferase (GNAT) domain